MLDVLNLVLKINAQQGKIHNQAFLCLALSNFPIFVTQKGRLY